MFSVLNLVVSLAVLLAGYGIVLLALVQLAVFAVALVLGIALATHKLARPGVLAELVCVSTVAVGGIALSRFPVCSFSFMTARRPSSCPCSMATW